MIKTLTKRFLIHESQVYGNDQTPDKLEQVDEFIETFSKKNEILSVSQSVYSTSHEIKAKYRTYGEKIETLNPKTKTWMIVMIVYKTKEKEHPNQKAL